MDSGHLRRSHRTAVLASPLTADRLFKTEVAYRCCHRSVLFCIISVARDKNSKCVYVDADLSRVIILSRAAVTPCIAGHVFSLGVRRPPALCICRFRVCRVTFRCYYPSSSVEDRSAFTITRAHGADLYESFPRVHAAIVQFMIARMPKYGR